MVDTRASYVEYVKSLDQSGAINGSRSTGDGSEGRGRRREGPGHHRESRQPQNPDLLNTSDSESISRPASNPPGPSAILDVSSQHGRPEIAWDYDGDKDLVTVGFVNRGTPAATDVSMEHFLRVASHAFNKVADDRRVDAANSRGHSRGYGSAFIKPTIDAVCKRLGSQHTVVGRRREEYKIYADWHMERDNNHTTVVNPHSLNPDNEIPNFNLDSEGQPTRALLDKHAANATAYLEARYRGEKINTGTSLNQIQLYEGSMAASTIYSPDADDFEAQKLQSLLEKVPPWLPSVCLE